jgi:isochorismate hydrolase
MTFGIQPIDAYPMPTGDEVPANQVDWELDPRRAVLLVHDMQDYFLRPFASRPPLPDLVRNVVLLREECAQLGIPVAYTAQPGSMTHEERGLLKAFWGPGMTASDADRRIADELAPHDGDQMFVKWRYSAFHRSGLLNLFRGSGRDQLIICGVYAHIGCLMTAVDAFTHDIQPFLVADGVADFSPAKHQRALSYAASCCAATPTTRRVLDSLRAHARTLTEVD